LHVVAVATTTASARRWAGVPVAVGTGASWEASTGAPGVTGGGVPVPAHAFALAVVVATNPMSPRWWRSNLGLLRRPPRRARG
jgi:hypothetical protein